MERPVISKAKISTQKRIAFFLVSISAQKITLNACKKAPKIQNNYLLVVQTHNSKMKIHS